MRASIQWLTQEIGLVRTHPVGEYGDPWTWACCIVKDGDTATVYIAEHAPTHAERSALKCLFLGAGISKVRWERKRGDAVTKEFSL